MDTLTKMVKATIENYESIKWQFISQPTLTKVEANYSFYQDEQVVFHLDVLILHYSDREAPIIINESEDDEWKEAEHELWADLLYVFLYSDTEDDDDEIEINRDEILINHFTHIINNDAKGKI